jgi:ribose transport system substrate-binding protein
MRNGCPRVPRLGGLAVGAVLAVTGCSTGTSPAPVAATGDQVAATASAGELRDHALKDMQAEAVQSLINDKPAVLVVHNFDVQILAKLIQQAQQAGTGLQCR